MFRRDQFLYPVGLFVDCQVLPQVINVVHLRVTPLLAGVIVLLLGLIGVRFAAGLADLGDQVALDDLAVAIC